MAKYKVEVLRPGVTAGVSATDREYTEDALREAMDSLDGVHVTTGSDRMSPSSVVGRVVDHEYDDGVVATVEIEDEATIEKIESGLAELAPALVMDSSDDEEPIKATDIEFRSLFLAPEASKLVGSTERAE